MRTTDVERARAFYTAVLGSCQAEMIALDPAALARGARPHWLGLIDVPRLEPMLAELVRRGAQPLGKKWTTSSGLEVAALRDPGGAVLAIAEGDASRHRLEPAPVWHQLNTAGVPEAKQLYGELFDWHFLQTEQVASVGGNHPFGWSAGQPAIGAMADIAGRPAVHAHWLFSFPVTALDAASERARALGGATLAPLELPSGDRMVVCDDPQGAAFALLERTES